jgi:hypothetical protein
MTSNVGKWDPWYRGVTQPERYGDETSYRAAADWLRDCDRIADWGCGKGGFSTFVPPEKYLGFDGSATPFVQAVVDLADFHCPTEGILLRHVVEHDLRWRDILANASASFTKRMMVVLFTPILEPVDGLDPVVDCIGSETVGPHQVPNLSFSRNAIWDAVGYDLLVNIEVVPSATQFGSETLFRFERREATATTP